MQRRNLRQAHCLGHRNETRRRGVTPRARGGIGDTPSNARKISGDAVVHDCTINGFRGRHALE
jgi:hypothetical protein